MFALRCCALFRAPVYTTTYKSTNGTVLLRKHYYDEAKDITFCHLCIPIDKESHQRKI